MPVIYLETIINAPVDVCFDLSRSIDLHMESTKQTGEIAIAGRTSGLMELGETVTWSARHLFIRQTLTSKITKMERPFIFVDEMVEGAFKSFRHEHRFVEENGHTKMTDVFHFESPMGWLGTVVNKLILTRYMTNLLIQRNKVIKQFAEQAQTKHGTNHLYNH